jgi:hypothetical protein
MAYSVPFNYRDFYDVPRMMLLRYRQRVILLDCPFDEAIDDYRSIYAVYMMADDADLNPTGSWRPLPTMAQKYLGAVPVQSVQFDPSRRKFITADFLDPLLNSA